MPDDSHSHPATEEAACEDVVPVKWEWPQDQCNDDVGHKEDGCDAQPFSDVPQSLGRHGVHDVVKVWAVVGIVYL